VDISIQESIASALRDVTSNYTYFGGVRRRQPNHSGDLTRLRAVSDGYILPNPGVSASVNWNAVVEFLEAPELDNEKFSTPSARLTNAAELGEMLDRIFLTKEKMPMFYGAHQRRFIYGVIDSPKEVLANPQLQARGYFVEIDHPATGALKYPGAPFIMNGTPWRGGAPAPTLGQHNREVFQKRFGYSDDDLARLRAMGVI
jgi:crotonobetainyl-CoA:carnitine CoA-transferase CaiB-like acyl-CoA transferase